MMVFLVDLVGLEGQGLEVTMETVGLLETQGFQASLVWVDLRVNLDQL